MFCAALAGCSCSRHDWRCSSALACWRWHSFWRGVLAAFTADSYRRLRAQEKRSARFSRQRTDNAVQRCPILSALSMRLILLKIVGHDSYLILRHCRCTGCAGLLPALRSFIIPQMCAEFYRKYCLPGTQTEYPSSDFCKFTLYFIAAPP